MQKVELDSPQVILGRLKGLSALTAEERGTWINKQVGSGKLPKNWTNSQAEQLYNNKLYIDEFGIDAFKANKDPKSRDAQFRAKLTNDAFQYYKDDENFDYLNSQLTDQGKIDLLESGYLNESDTKKDVENFKKKYNEASKVANFLSTSGDPVVDISRQQARELAPDYDAQVNKSRQEKLTEVITKDNDRKEEAAIPEKNQLAQFYHTEQNAWVEANSMFRDLFKDKRERDESLDDVISFMANNFLIAKEHEQALNKMPVEERVNYVGQILEQSEFNPSRVDNLFSQVSEARTIEYETPFGPSSITLPGSATYRQLGSTDRFNNFSAEDKLDAYLTWQVMSDKYGTDTAISNLETSLLRYAKEHEGAKEWASDVLLNITLGGVANIMNKVNAVSNVIAAGKYGQEGLANILEGKNPDGSEREQNNDTAAKLMLLENAIGIHNNNQEVNTALGWMIDNAFNPHYWNKVDEYNTLDPLEIAKADANSGISPYIKNRIPGEKLRFLSDDTLREALKMTKFVWSDYLVGQLLGGATKGATGLTNKMFGANVAGAVNKAGAIGTVLASGMGIAESYGVMTYDQTKQDELELLDKKLDREAQQYALNLQSTPEAQEEIDTVVKQQLYQLTLQAIANHEVPPTEEEVRKAVEANFLNYHRQNWYNTEEGIALRVEGEKQAQKDAVDSYIVDATIEEIRMAASNFAFRKYLFDKGTLKALGDNSKTYTKVNVNEDGTLSPINKALNRAGATLKPFWGGFQSNYFDDVTVGFGKGFGLGQYNAWLQNKFDASKAERASELPFSFLEGLNGATAGAKEALYDRQSFYDGFVGALGSLTSITPRTSANKAETLEAMGKTPQDELTFLQKVNREVMNPLLDAYFNAVGNEGRTQEDLKKVNEVLANKKDAVNSIVNTAIRLNATAESNQSNSMLDRKKAKQDEAFQLMYELNGMTSSSLIKKSPIVQEAGKTIDRLARGGATDEEIRQMMNQPGNKDLTEQEARARLQKNAKSLKEMSNRIAESGQIINQGVLGHNVDNDTKEELIYHLAMDKTWQEQYEEMEKTISKGKPSDKSHSAIALYGNKREFDRNVLAQKAKLRKLAKDVEISRNNLKIATDIYNKVKNNPKADPAIVEKLKAELLMHQLDYQTAIETAREAELVSKQMQKDAEVFENELPVLSSDEILKLNPEERAVILNKENYKNYSQEQQAEIDKAIADIRTRSTDVEGLIADSGELATRIKDNKKAYNRMLSNPEAATAYVTSIKRSRERHLADVFAQRRIDDAFNTLDEAQTDEELRATAKNIFNSKELGIKSGHIDEYLERHPEKSNVLKGFADVARIREDAFNAIKAVVAPNSRDIFIKSITEATVDATNAEEAMSSLEDLLDSQAESTTKLQFDRVLEEMKKLGYERNATKIRNREEERKRKQEEEVKRLEEEEKKNGKRYNWDGYKVGDTIYSKQSGKTAHVHSFEDEDTMVVAIPVTTKQGTGVEYRRYHADQSKDLFSKEKPVIKEKTPSQETKTRRGDRQINKAISDLRKAQNYTEKADAIAFYETAKYRGAETTAEENAEIKKAKDELRKEGIEYIDMLGKPYNDGMKVTANFVEDESLTPGETKIIGVRVPQLNKEGKMIQSAEITVAQNSLSNTVLTDVWDITLDSEGGVNSPNVDQQAAQAGSQVIEVPKVDTTDQDNNIDQSKNDIVSGTRFSEYSISSLKEGIVKEEVPNDTNNAFYEFVIWLHNTDTKLQEIIDEEFGKMLVDNPDLKIQFMMMKPSKQYEKLSKMMFNVVELTPELRQKYHKDERGGVIQANGKAWLVVGIDGFDSRASQAERNNYDATMKGPISKRRYSYFENNASENYYVDPVAYTNVQNTTSGRIIIQNKGAEAPRLKKISELLKSADMTLKQAQFGIQTKRADNTKGFAVTKNVGKEAKVFPPRNVEDNRGRTFILLDTPNGNKIPAMIEPAMYNNLAEDSPLREMIDATIAELFSTKYEIREDAIKRLCGLLVLNDSKNILVGTEEIPTITIRQEGLPDITQKLGQRFDSIEFFKDLRAANFQVNVTLSTLENPSLLKIYDDSNALMTNVDSMRTVGMSYTVYKVNSSGKPIKITPVGNAVPGTGTSEIKRKRGVRVDNTMYDREPNGQFINRNTRDIVESGSQLETSCIYNEIIDSGRATLVATEKNKKYYNVPTSDGRTAMVSRDNLGNITFLTNEESEKINKRLQDESLNEVRAKNLQDVLLDEEQPPVEQDFTKAELDEESLTDVQIEEQFFGNFEAPTQPEVKSQPQKEVVKEAKETQPTESKEIITDLGIKPLTELQKTEKSFTFVDIATNFDYVESLYEILEGKNWGITGDFLKDAEVLKAHNIQTTNISNIEAWLDLIKNCR